MKIFCILTAVLFLFMDAATAWADATVETFNKFSGFKGTGAYEGTTVTWTKADRQSESSVIKFTGAILSRAGGAGEKSTITRIDKGVVWSLFAKKKTYHETPIASYKPDDPATGREQPAGDEKEKPKVKVTRNEFGVRKTGKKETISDYPCEEYLMTWLMEMENPETKEKSRNIMTSSLWTTKETAAIRKLRAEEEIFSKAYMKKIGLKYDREEMKQFGMGVFSQMNGTSEKDLLKHFGVLKKEMSKVKGYPIRTVVTWKVECNKAAGQENPDTGVSPVIDLSGGWGGIISSVIGNTVKEQVLPDDNAPFFSGMTEVRSIRTDSIPASAFEIPAGYMQEGKTD